MPVLKTKAEARQELERAVNAKLKKIYLVFLGIVGIAAINNYGYLFGLAGFLDNNSAPFAVL